LSEVLELNPKEYAATLTLLKSIDFLHGVPEDELKNVLFSLQKQTFSADKKILFQGEIANRLFIIRQGKVIITTRTKTGKIVLAELVAPMYFGEVSLLRPMSATATATAGEQGADVIILTHDSLSELGKRIPDIEQRIQKIIDSRLTSKQQAKQKDADDDEAKE
jgi:CRP-like cAMP-binding protein